MNQNQFVVTEVQLCVLSADLTALFTEGRNLAQQHCRGEHRLQTTGSQDLPTDCLL